MTTYLSFQRMLDDFKALLISLVFNYLLLAMMSAMSMQPKAVELELNPVPVSLIQLPRPEEKKAEEKKKEVPPPPPPEEVPAEKPEDIPKEEIKEEPEEEPPPPARPAPPKLPEAIPLHRLTAMPGFNRRVEPVYPESLRIAGIEGKVVVEVLISAQGAVINIKVLKSDNEEFTQAVIRAIESSEFITGRVEGKPVPVKVQIPFSFKLN